jgi:hypothetical protein
MWARLAECPEKRVRISGSASTLRYQSLTPSRERQRPDSELFLSNLLQPARRFAIGATH